MFAYAAVAGAGLLAAAPSAEAGVIYNPTTFTKNYPGAGGFSIDLNADAQNDFWFNSSHFWTYRSFFASAANYAGILTGAGGAQFVPGSNFIGPANGPWGSYWLRMARAAGTYTYGFGSPGSSYWLPLGVSGQFANKDGYLGVRIPTAPQSSSYYYGWIRFDITASDQTPNLPIGVTVKGWAYENTPDTPIHAGDQGGVPEPGSLGLLADGILGLAAWRRRKAAKSPTFPSQPSFLMTAGGQCAVCGIPMISTRSLCPCHA